MNCAPPSDAQTRFSDRVDHYVKHRPSYPAVAIDRICAFAGIRAGSVVADVGAGTGISCKPFLDRGCVVRAVEPNAAMRAAAVDAHRGNPRFEAVEGSAERTNIPDGSVDLVASFQAFHWFDPAHVGGEFRRIAKPTGCVAIVWNERRTSGTPFLEGYDELLLAHGTDYKSRIAGRVTSVTQLEHVFKCSFIAANFSNEQTFDYPALLGRLRSSSYTPSPEMDNYGDMVEALRRLFDRCQVNGRVRIEYDTEVYLGRFGA